MTTPTSSRFKQALLKRREAETPGKESHELNAYDNRNAAQGCPRGACEASEHLFPPPPTRIPVREKGRVTRATFMLAGCKRLGSDHDRAVLGCFAKAKPTLFCSASHTV